MARNIYLHAEPIIVPLPFRVLGVFRGKPASMDSVNGGREAWVAVLFGNADENGLSTFPDATEMLWNAGPARSGSGHGGLRPVCGAQDGAIAQYVSQVVWRHGAHATGV